MDRRLYDLYRMRAKRQSQEFVQKEREERREYHLAYSRAYARQKRGTTPTKICVMCGVVFGTWYNAITCSPACSYERHRQNRRRQEYARQKRRLKDPEYRKKRNAAKKRRHQARLVIDPAYREKFNAGRRKYAHKIQDAYHNAKDLGLID